MKEAPAIRSLTAKDWAVLASRSREPLSEPAKGSGVVARAIEEALLALTGVEMSASATVVAASGRYGYERMASDLIGAVFALDDADAAVRFGIELPELRRLVDMACGGAPEEPMADATAPLGRIERALCVGVFDQISQTMSDALEKSGEKRMEATRGEASLEAAWRTQAGEGAALIAVAIDVSESVRHMIVELPSALLARLSGEGLVCDAGDDDVAARNWRASLTDQIAATTLSLSAIIVEDGFTLGDLESVCVGTTLSLRSSPRSIIRLSAEDRPLFQCDLGQDDGHYTLRIAQEQRS